ncbi:MAG: BamA/TamA family outer membrane protein [Planctomycetota bacterium]
MQRNTGDEFNPYAGVEENGRIPKAELPADLNHPDRWRYYPEGRIPPGNILQRWLTTSFIAPVFFFESDIGAGGGINLTDLDFRHKRRQELANIFLSYTSEGQQRFSLTWWRWTNHRELPEGGVILEERSYVNARIGYQRTLTRRFFGFGARTKERDESAYTEEKEWLSVELQQSIPDPGHDLILRLGARLEHRNLGAADVDDTPSTKVSFPTTFDDDDNHDMLWIEGGLRWDTRDSQHLPYEGWHVGIDSRAAPLQTHGDTGVLISTNGSWITPVPTLLHDDGDATEEHPPTDSIAIGARVDWLAGDLPFWARPSLGGADTLRGFIGNRWTDDAAWHSSIEYRFWAIPRGFAISEGIRIERLGAALFYEIGSVASDIGKLDGAQVHDSYGFSLRATVDRQAVFRIDFGYSDEGSNLTIAYGLSF